MNFFKQFFKNSKTKEDPKGPERIELIKDKLYVKVVIQELRCGGPYDEMKSLAFLTEGLYSIGQKELFFVLTNYGADYQKMYGNIFQYFITIYELSKHRRFVDIGEITAFGKNDLLGWKGIVYNEIPDHLTDFFKSPTLSVLLLSEEEIKSIGSYGRLRILSMLGNSSKYFPYPFWSDLKRKQLPIGRMANTSMLSKTEIRLPLKESTVTLINNKIFFKIEKEKTIAVHKELQEQRNPFVIFPFLDKSANACLTYTFDNNENGPGAISPPGSKGTMVGACTLLLVPQQDNYSSRILEDGFCLFVTNNQIDEFFNAIENKRSFDLNSEKNMSFSMEWI